MKEPNKENGASSAAAAAAVRRKKKRRAMKQMQGKAKQGVVVYTYW